MKRKFVSWLKFLILCYGMTMGLFCTYCLIYMMIIPTMPGWMVWVILTLASLSTWRYIEWLRV